MCCHTASSPQLLSNQRLPVFVAITAPVLISCKSMLACNLPGAYLPADRQNVTVEGISVPLGVVNGAWTSSRIAIHVLSILLEEKLGYNTTITESPTTTQGVSMVAGCVDPGQEDVADRDCNHTFSAHHIYWEAWDSLRDELNNLTESFELTAPEELGTVGYSGTEGLYIDNRILLAAEASEGLPLEFYKSYNVSWHNVASYFTDYRRIPTSKLMNCSAGDLWSHVWISKYFSITHDVDGVETLDNKPRAKCEGGAAGHWWLSPSCRSNPSRCFPVIDGGNGWFTEATMVRSTVFNMPIAYAIASGEQEYGQLPSTDRTMFYQHEPDDKFSMLSPSRVIFPPHNVGQWKEGDYRTAEKEWLLSKWIHYAMPLYSASAEFLARNMVLSPEQLEAMIFDFASSNHTEWQSACNWLKQNDVWHDWVAAPTKCFEGQGLVVSDESSKTRYVQKRSLARSCDWCMPGRSSQRLLDDQGSTFSCRRCGFGSYQDTPGKTACKHCDAGRQSDSRGNKECELCSTGTFSSVQGATACELCHPGKYTSQKSGSTHCDNCDKGLFWNMSVVQSGKNAMTLIKCIPCQIGQYADSVGMSICISCNHNRTSSSGWTTMKKVGGKDEWIYFEGASSRDSCGCDKGWRLENERCVACEEGMICDGMGEIIIEQGYYSELPVSVYHCFADEKRCPGGRPQQTCAAGRTGISCAKCEEFKWEWWGGDCMDCENKDFGPLIAAFAIGTTIIGIVYYLLSHINDKNSEVGGSSYTVMQAMVACSQLLGLLQHLCIIGNMSVDFGEPTKTFLRLVRVFAFRLDFYRMGCWGVHREKSLFIISALTPFAWLACALLVHFIVGLLFHERKSKFCQSLIAILGTNFLMFYVAILSIVMEPLECAEHPNGQKTVRAYNSIRCWDSSESSDHTVMVLLGMCCLTVPLAFFAFAVWVTCQLPRKVRTGNVGFLKRYRFLYLRFRPRGAPYIIVLLVKSLLIALTPLLPTPSVQVFVADLVIIATLLFQMHLKPWRLIFANVIDMVYSTIMLMVVMIAAFFVQEDEFLPTLSWMCGVFILGSVCLVPVMIARALFFLVSERCGCKRKRYRFFLCHHKARAGAFARLLKSVLVEHPRLYQEVFLDSDDLSLLDDLFHIVGNDVERLVIVGTKDVFLRPWCAGEMTVARLKKLDVMILAMPDWEAPSDETIEHFEEWVDMTPLIQNRISLGMAQETLRWLRTLPTKEIPRHISDKTLNSLVSEMLPSIRDGIRDSIKEGIREGVSLQRTLPGHVKSHVPTLFKATSLTSEVWILADKMDTEAVATGYILARFMLPHMMHAPRSIPTVVQTGEEMLSTCKSLILICTSGCFSRRSFLEVLLLSCRTGVAVLPVAADPAFKFPTPDSLEEMRAKPTGVKDLSGERLAEMVQNIFREIAAKFQPQQASDAILRENAKQISLRVLGGSMKEMKMSAGDVDEFECRNSRGYLKKQPPSERSLCSDSNPAEGTSVKEILSEDGRYQLVGETETSFFAEPESENEPQIIGKNGNVLIPL